MTSGRNASESGCRDAVDGCPGNDDDDDDDDDGGRLERRLFLRDLESLVKRRFQTDVATDCPPGDLDAVDDDVDDDDLDEGRLSGSSSEDVLERVVCSEFSDDYASMTTESSSTTTTGRRSSSIGDNPVFYNDDDAIENCSSAAATVGNFDDGDSVGPDVGQRNPASAQARCRLPVSSSNVRRPDVDPYDVDDVDDDLEYNFVSRPIPMRRSTSLKTSYPSSPSTPNTKKAVRFADALGLDLESVRNILDAGDLSPPFRMWRQPSSSSSTSAAGLRSSPAGGVGGTRRHLLARFAEPGSSPEFLRRVQERKVSLERCSVDAVQLTVSGVVRVANIGYRKQVTVRYSTNNWATYSDVDAVYLPADHPSASYDGGLTDAFAFHVRLRHDQFGDCSRPLGGGLMEFSIRYIVGGDIVFWDGNFGANYCVEYVVDRSPSDDDDNGLIG